MDLDQSSDPAKEGNLPEQTTSASRSLTSNDEKGIQQHRVRAALISAFVPNQNIVNKALDPRRRSKIPENATQSAVSADNHSTTEQPEAQAGSSEPLILGFTATPASAAQGISTMSSPALTNGTLASVSGIVTTDTGERVVPSTTRPDGSVRPTKKVKCGWIPREDGLPYKPPLRTGFDGRLSGPSELEGSKAVLEVSQEAASIPETTDSEQNKSHLFLEALAAEITAQDKSEPSVTEHNHTNRVQGIQSSVGGDQANNNLTSSSASSIEHKINEGIPAQTSDQPATPPSQSEGKQDLCTPLVIGANKVSGCDISPTALPMSPQTSPPRNSELNLFSPVIESRPLSTPSRKKPEAPPVKARQQRPRWYDDTYVVRMKLDAEYEKMKENLRVERFYIKGSRSYSVTLVPPLPAKSSRTAIKKQWFRLIDQQHPDSRLSKHPGFQTVVDDTTAGKLSIPSRAKPTEDDKTSPNSPLEPSDEDPMSSDNRQDTPENGSPYTAGSPDTPTPAERPVAKREHSPSEPPKAKKSKKIKQTLKRADIASRLLEDSRGEVEYIKGEGPRRVNQDLFSSSPSSQSDGEVASESSARYKLKLALTDFIEVKSDGIVKKRERPDLLYLHWIGHRKLLFLSYNNVEVKDTLIKMDQILKVHYGSTPFQIHIEYGFDALAGLANPQHDLYLLLGCDQAQFTTLQGSLSRHVGGMRVNRVLEPIHFDIKIRELRNLVPKGGRKTNRALLKTSGEHSLKTADSTGPDPRAANQLSTTSTTSLPASSPKIATRPKDSSYKPGVVQDKVAGNQRDTNTTASAEFRPDRLPASIPAKIAIGSIDSSHKHDRVAEKLREQDTAASAESRPDGIPDAIPAKVAVGQKKTSNDRDRVHDNVAENQCEQNIATSAETRPDGIAAAISATVAIGPKDSSKKRDRVQDKVAKNPRERSITTSAESKPDPNVVPLPNNGTPDPKSSVISNVRSGLCYSNGYEIAVGDLVVRRRDPQTMANGANKQDRYDIFDGPYPILKVTQLASSTLRNASKSKNEKQEVLASTINEKTHEEMKSGGEEISKNMNKSEIEAMQETLVKLKFPKESANPWTKLSRLIPVLEFNKEIVSQSGDMVPVSVDDNAGSMPLAGAPPIQPGTIAERATKNVLHLQTDMPVHSSDETPAGMVKLCKGVHVAVHYVAPDSPASGSHYEVDKLRGKRLRRFQGKEAKGLKTDREDPWVRKYIQSKGSPKKGEVLVAEYLVHWSGWPSECDTWERGEGNIPDSFLREYAEKTDPYRDIGENDGDELSDPEALIHAPDRQVSKKDDKRRTSGGSSNGKRGRPRKSNEAIVIDSSPPAITKSPPKSPQNKKRSRNASQAKLIDDQAGEGKAESDDEEARQKKLKKQKRKS